MPQILPIKELRNTNNISEKYHAKPEPIFITKNGYGDLVVMSIEVYESLLDSASVDFAIQESEAEIAEGVELIDARETLGTLRRKYIG